MARKPRAKLKPIGELSKRQAARRRMARRLHLGNEDRFQRWLTRHRNLPESDPRYLDPAIKENDFAELNRIRQVDKRWKSPPQRLLAKKEILVDNLKKMSNFGFLDQYEEQIRQMLRDPSVSDYMKRKIRHMQSDLRRGVNTEPGQMVLPLEWWRK